MVSLTIYSVVIFNQLDSDCINFKNFGIPGCLFWSEHHLHNTDIEVQQVLNGASTMLNNVFKRGKGNNNGRLYSLEDKKS